MGYFNAVSSVFSVEEDSPVTVNLTLNPEGGHLSGHVYADLGISHNPLGSASIELGSTPPQLVQSDDEGVFSFLDIPTGTYPLTITHSGLTPFNGTVSSPAGLIASHSYTLLPLLP